ncbi:MAG: hypothetical protein WAT79_08975 [Saprospiraceae bacterium]
MNTFNLGSKDDENRLVDKDKFVYSTKEKEADNFLIIKSIADSVASQYRSEEDIKKNVENMNIHMGRWNNIMTPNQILIKLKGGETIKYGRTTTRHSPYIDIVTQSIAKDFKDKPIKNIIRDMSANALITRKTKQKEITKAKLQEVLVRPVIQQATQEVDSRMGDPLQLNNEQLSQRNSDIESIVSNTLSDEIKAMLENLTLPTEELLKKFHDIAFDRTDMKFTFEEGIDYFICTGIEAYKKRFGNKEVYMDAISPPDLTYKLKYNSIFFEKGLYANHKRYLTPMEVIQEGYHVFKGKDWDEIERMFVAIPETSYYSTGADLVYNRSYKNVDPGISFTVPIVDGGVDVARNEYRPYMLDGRNGVLWANNIMNKMTEAFQNRKVGIMVDSPTWRMNAKAVVVTRSVNGRKVELIRGENYKMDKTAGDLEIRDTVIPQTWGLDIYSNKIYSNIGPIIGQYSDPIDISEPNLNIYGAVYSTMSNNVSNLSLMEPAKVYQLRLNHVEHSIEEAIQFNIGTALVVNKKTFEGSGGPQGFFDMLYKLKTIVTEDEQFSGGGGNDTARSIRPINMNNGINIGEYTNLSQYYQQMIVKSLRYNNSKMGNAGQYENQANIQAGLAAPDRQLGRYHDINLKVRTNVSRALLQGALYAYRDNDPLLENYLDERLYYHYRENYNSVIGTSFTFNCESSVEEVNNIREYKQYLKNFMATGGNLDNLADAIRAKDMDAAKEVGKLERLYREKQTMEQRRHEQEIADKNSKAVSESTRAQIEADNKRHGIDIDAGREKAYLNSMQMANANDINLNSIPDQIERDKEKEQTTLKMHDDKMEIEKEKLKIEEKKADNILKKPKT